MYRRDPTSHTTPPPTRGLPGDLVTQWGGSSYNTVDYYPDGLGSTAYVADSNKSVIEQYTYDAHGAPSFFNAQGNALSGSACATDHLFTGQQWHPAPGLYDNRNRFYSPEWGRFLQPDPIGFAGDPANIYRYCGNNPVNRSDPNGLGENPWESMPGQPPQLSPQMQDAQDTAIQQFITVIQALAKSGALPSTTSLPPVAEAGSHLYI